MLAWHDDKFCLVLARKSPGFLTAKTNFWGPGPHGKRREEREDDDEVV